MDWSKKLENRRIGNIELRYSNCNNCWEIVKWYPNEMFNNRQDFIWDDTKGMYRHKEFSYYVSEAHFTSTEFCYVVAFLELTRADDEEGDINSVGARPWRLNSNDAADYQTIINYIFDLD